MKWVYDFRDFAKLSRLGDRIITNSRIGVYEGDITMISLRGCNIQLVNTNKTMFVKWANINRLIPREDLK